MLVERVNILEIIVGIKGLWSCDFKRNLFVLFFDEKSLLLVNVRIYFGGLGILKSCVCLYELGLFERFVEVGFFGYFDRS